MGIQVVNEDLLTHEATPSCKDICTPDSLLCHVSSFTFLQISYYHVMKQSFTIGCSPLYSHKSISTRIGRPCLFHASHPNPSVLFVRNWVCQLQSAWHNTGRCKISIECSLLPRKSWLDSFSCARIVYPENLPKLIGFFLLMSDWGFLQSKFSSTTLVLSSRKH